MRTNRAGRATRSILLVATATSLPLVGACSTTASTTPATSSSASPTSPPGSGPSAPATSAPATSSRPPATRGATTTSEAAEPVTTAAGARRVDIGELTVEVPADATVPDPEAGVTLTAGSVYRLPGESLDELADVDVTTRQVTSDGRPVIIYLFGSDTLFDVGSAEVKSTAEAALPAVVTSVGRRAPSARLLVRGFTDSTGGADANKALSQRRADAITSWLATHGIDRGRITATGLGSSHPAAEETSEAGTALNRRIEIVAIG